MPVKKKGKSVSADFRQGWLKIIGVVVVVFVIISFLQKDDRPMLDAVSSYAIGSQSRSFDMAEESSAKLMALAPEMAMADVDLAANRVDGAEVVVTSGRDIIRTGNLDLVVVSVEESVQRVKDLVSRLEGGFVAEASINEIAEGQKSGWMRIRVPAKQFDTVVEQLKGFAVRVQSENAAADDVTKQVTDVEARLNNLRLEEAQFADILKTANTVEDVLNVTEQLNRVRGEIERIEVQLRDLNESVALSTIYINMTDEGNVKILGVYWRPLISLKQALRGAIENVTAVVDFTFELLVNLPLLALVGFVLYLVWGGVQKLRSKFTKRKK